MAVGAEATEAFVSETSASWHGSTTLVVLQDRLQGALSESDWGPYLELKLLSNERSARLQEVLVRWAFGQGIKMRKPKLAMAHDASFASSDDSTVCLPW